MLYFSRTKLIRAATGQYGAKTMKNLSKSTQAVLFFLFLSLPLLAAAIFAISKCTVINLM